MYGLMWRILPGPWASKLIMMVGLLAGGAALLWFFAFPALSPHMPFNDGAVDSSGFGEQEPQEVPVGETDPTGEEGLEIEGGPEAEEVLEAEEGA